MDKIRSKRKSSSQVRFVVENPEVTPQLKIRLKKHTRQYMSMLREGEIEQNGYQINQELFKILLQVEEVSDNVVIASSVHTPSLKPKNKSSMNNSQIEINGNPALGSVHIPTPVMED